MAWMKQGVFEICYEAAHVLLVLLDYYKMHTWEDQNWVCIAHILPILRVPEGVSIVFWFTFKTLLSACSSSN